MKKKMLPVGIEDFKEIVTEDFYYVDKTAMIRDLLNGWSKVTLFTRPRRFGKSLNMSMLRHFFEVGTDRKLFEGLEISKETKLCESYMGKFPVISMSLKGVAGINFEHAIKVMNGIIRNEIRRHQYLLNSNRLSDVEKKECEKLFSDKISDNCLDNSIWTLSQMLHKHYGEKVVILIDEYDVPLAKAFDYGYYDEMVVFIRNILHQALKTNESLQFAVLTGCMRIAKESIFTGLNNLRTMSLTNTYFNEYFGFTDDDVKELLKYYGLEEKHKTARTWYNGYLFGDQSVYCPWDVINFTFDQLKNKDMRPENYWSNTSSNNIIRRFLDKADETTRWEIEQLIEGKTIEKEVYQELTYAELDKTINHLWSVLFTTGYLTYQKSERNSKSDNFDESFGSGLHSNTFKLKIPNEEIRYIFKNHVYTWFNDYVETDEDRYKKFSQAFIDGNAQQIQDMFGEYLMETISIRDTSVKKSMKENFYHGVLLGILKYRRDWIVRSNHESGDGYNDIMIMYNTKRIGIVIEVKYAQNSDLDLECKKALDQIEKLRYIEALTEHEPIKIYKYAIACYKKRCRVVMKEETF